MSPVDLPPLNPKSPARTARSHSISSDRTSLTGHGGLLSPPLTIIPDAGFIAASAASQIVTNDHDSHSDTWFDQHGIEPSGETALVAPPALTLVNRFLDQLLFNFLSVSKSTSLASLRPAVGEILKTKLARDAIHGADQELHEYLGGGEEEELLSFHNGIEPNGDWDLELVWKRTRLRCMVYSSLGDMEEEDEDFYTEQGQLETHLAGSSHFSNNPGVVSPAVAIFLTSILEFMGEQVLVVAGQSAYQRLRAKHEREERDGTSTQGDIAERVVVEESDVERVALDRTLGRLWRGWKKRIRSPNASVSLGRSFSRESILSQPQTINGNAGTKDTADRSRRPSLAAVLAEFEHAAAIPLPLSADDVREIEIPGLAAPIRDEEDVEDGPVSDEATFRVQRRKSLSSLLSADLSSNETLLADSSKMVMRKRSNSQPTPGPSQYNFTHSQPARSNISSATSTKFDTQDSQDASTAGVVSTSHESTDQTEQDSSDKVPSTQEADPAAPPEPDMAEKELAQSTELETQSEGKGTVAGIVSRAAVLGTAAVTGIVAAATGKAVQTEAEPKDGLDQDDDLGEEPQIMTSSRVSLGGRISPDSTLSRHSSVRSQSMHSPRLIDVASAKNPSRSRHGSLGATDHPTGRPDSLSRSDSFQSPNSDHTPRVGSPIARIHASSPVARNNSSLGSRSSRNGAEASISEEKEVFQGEQTPLTGVPADYAEAMQGVDVHVEPTPHIDDPGQEVQTHKQLSSIISAAPISRQPQNALPQQGDKESQSRNISMASKETDVDNGAPPLTPLREMMEGAPDTSDEANSTAPSSYSRTASEHGAYGHSPSASASTLSHSQRDQQRLVRGQPTPLNRNSPPRLSPPRKDPARKIDGDSLTKQQRSAHNSGSTSSNTSHKLKLVRTSEESPSNSVEDKGQSFEQLIRSDQTIQYTLTPQNMRNIESPESPRHVSPTILSNGHDTRRPATRGSHASVSKPVTAQLNTPIDPPRSPKLRKANQPSQLPAVNSGTRVRTNAPAPRDARVDRDSMGDFADFIRSTGPANGDYSAPPQSVQSHRGANGTSRNFSGSMARTSEPTSLPRRAESSAGRSRLQARDAVVPRGDSISDLIDFVRSGPQLEKDNHRIPRTVAPFRSTMDSDQMSGVVGGKAIDASLPDPRASQATSVSFNSSVNSQSALLSNSSKARTVLSHGHMDTEEPDMMPKRKTRRVRDPYAIDLSDEEEEYQALSRPKPIQEESLADFLRNVPPPPDSTPAPIFEAARPATKDVKKKSSSSSFRSRFGRKESSGQPLSKPKSKGNDSRSPASRNGVSQMPTHTPIAAQFSTTSSPHEPSRNGSNYASQVDTARNKVAQKSYQPREAIYSNVRTNELADFLRRSEPPSTMQAQPQTFTPTLQKEEGAFQRMFGRKKVN